MSTRVLRLSPLSGAVSQLAEPLLVKGQYEGKNYMVFRHDTYWQLMPSAAIVLASMATERRIFWICMFATGVLDETDLLWASFLLE